MCYFFSDVYEPHLSVNARLIYADRVIFSVKKVIQNTMVNLKFVFL